MTPSEYTLPSGKARECVYTTLYINLFSKPDETWPAGKKGHFMITLVGIVIAP